MDEKFIDYELVCPDCHIHVQIIYIAFSTDAMRLSVACMMCEYEKDILITFSAAGNFARPN